MVHNGITQYLQNIGSALSQVLHSVFGGNPDITLSAATHVRAERGSYFHGILEQVIDVLFFWEENHCANAFERDKANAIKTLEFLNNHDT